MGPDRVPKPPRPSNAWILYRSEKIKHLPPLSPGAPKRAQADVSRMISRMWREASPDTRSKYEKQADVRKAEHQARYPGYRFQPVRKAEKEKLRLENERGLGSDRKSIMTMASYPAYAIQYPLTNPNDRGPSPPLSDASSTPASFIPSLELDSPAPSKSRRVSRSTEPSSSEKKIPIAPPSQLHPPAPEQLPTYDQNSQQISDLWCPTFLYSSALQLPIHEPQAPPNISFEISKPEIQVWNPSEHGALPFTQDVSSVSNDSFQTFIDPSLLTIHPSEGYSLSYSHIQQPPSSCSWMHDISAVQNDDFNNLVYNPIQINDAIEDSIPQQHQAMMKYINLNYDAVYQQYPNAVPSSSTSLP